MSVYGTIHSTVTINSIIKYKILLILHEMQQWLVAIDFIGTGQH